MNFIFISPHFPESYWLFCQGLKNNGVNVLAIADTPYNSLSTNLKNSINDFYQVSSLENYDEMLRAVAWFTYKHGKLTGSNQTMNTGFVRMQRCAEISMLKPDSPAKRLTTVRASIA